MNKPTVTLELDLSRVLSLSGMTDGLLELRPMESRAQRLVIYVVEEDIDGAEAQLLVALLVEPGSPIKIQQGP